MNDTPVNGPMTASSTHHEREATSSRHSLSSSQTNGGLRKRKEEILEVRGIRGGRTVQVAELLDRALAADAAAAQQDEAIADAGGVADLVDREEQRAAGGGVVAQRGADFTRLPEVEAVERLVAQQQRVRHQHAGREHD